MNKKRIHRTLNFHPYIVSHRLSINVTQKFACFQLKNTVY